MCSTDMPDPNFGNQFMSELSAQVTIAGRSTVRRDLLARDLDISWPFVGRWHEAESSKLIAVTYRVRSSMRRRFMRVSETAKLRWCTWEPCHQFLVNAIDDVGNHSYAS